MFRTIITSGCVLFLAVSLGTAKVHADDPNEILQNCSAKLLELTETCTGKIKEHFERCSPTIRQLIAANRIDEAKSVARACIRQIDNTVFRCENAIDTLCRRCVNKLRDLGAPRLANAFKNRCDQAKRMIHGQANRAKQALIGFFD